METYNLIKTGLNQNIPECIKCKKTNISITCRGSRNINPQIGGDMIITLEEVNLNFIQDIPISDIVSYTDNEKLFKAIIENDPKILKDYLKEKNYGHYYTAKGVEA